jgi:hypothetical protein
VRVAVQMSKWAAGSGDRSSSGSGVSHRGESVRGWQVLMAEGYTGARWAANGREVPEGLWFVVDRRDSVFCLLMVKAWEVLVVGDCLMGCWGPAPRPPGFIALGHQQVFAECVGSWLAWGRMGE